MATLREYFAKDGRLNLTAQETWPLQAADGRELGEVTGRVHYDFEANAVYASFYIPSMPEAELPEAIALNQIPTMLGWSQDKTQVQGGFGTEMKDARELNFTGQIYLYSERPVPEAHRERLEQEGARLGHRLTFRSVEYVNERNKWQGPKAFVSHDSRDKAAIAEPLAAELSAMQLPVWYDDYSLRVGDSLRDSIERGLKECHRCVLILTPNFLRNGGWSKREYDSIFTRELVEKRNLILPIWHDVSVEQVFDYSPVLADRFALKWSEGVARVASKLYSVIESAE